LRWLDHRREPATYGQSIRERESSTNRPARGAVDAIVRLAPIDEAGVK